MWYEPESLPLLGFQGCRLSRWVDEGAAHKLQGLIDQDHREGKHEHQEPLVQGERYDGEDAGQNRHIQDEEVQAKGEGHSHQQPGVAPWRHLQQRVVLQGRQDFVSESAIHSAT